ncbi:inosine-uridine preferring nucleoside hydrolase domain-containing protein [Ditylenchus destructor]|nr:inosine-uridine preferring nucleoside hydrolase domain-containing protein [Ditylenchus destructor]
MILDSDFTNINDDGQVLAMAAQLHAAKKVNLLGLTIVSGNYWLIQEVANGLKAVERLGIEYKTGVYAGANDPLVHTYETYLYEQQQFGSAQHWVGAYTTPRITAQNVTAPPDGFATHTKPRRQNAVDFIIKSVHKYPGEVSIVAIGPLTNIALALRVDPTIEPLIKEIIIMGGQIAVPGNSYRGAGEFNWWFDAESVQAVLRANISKVIVPLDVTNTVPLIKSVYYQIANHTPSTIITQLYGADNFNRNEGSMFDQIAMAIFYNSSLITNSTTLYVDINACGDDENYGKSVYYTESNVPNSVLKTYQQSKVVFGIDNDAFYALYVDLLTRKVPA